jgi:hypothetical protein
MGAKLQGFAAQPKRAGAADGERLRLWQKSNNLVSRA